MRLGVLILVLTAGWLLLTRSFLTRALVLGQVGGLLGGELSAESLTVGSGGHVEATGLVLTARGVEGPAAEIVRIGRLEAEVGLWSVIRGSPEVMSLTLTSPVVRVSQSVDDNTLNFASLQPRSLSGSRPARLPRVLVSQGVIEIGEHVTDPDRLARGEAPFRLLRQFPVSGEVERVPDSEGEMAISFRQLGPDGTPMQGPGSVLLEGRASGDRVRLRLGELSLASWAPESLPAGIREALTQLRLEGSVTDAELTYTNAGGVEARAKLSGVALTLPVQTQPDVDADGNPLPMTEEDKARRLRLQNVSGELSVSQSRLQGVFDGVVEELPYHVEFLSRGTSADAAFDCRIVCENFRMETRPQVLRFAPGLVRRRLQQFSDPTGMVDLDVSLTRGAPSGGVAPPVAVRGTLRFRDATAAFERFPYRFTKLTGEFAFTDNRIDIKRVAGGSPGGATIEAAGFISPLTDDAEVRVNVNVHNLPVDGNLAKAMQARGKVIDELCSQERYDALAQRGLITPPEHAARATPDAPVFELGGRVNVLAVITREPGPDSNWHDTITITMPKVGILPRSAPLPMIARDVTIIKTDDEAVVRGGRLEGLQGGHATITARADLPALTTGGAFSPEVQVAARGVPLTRLLLAAMEADPDAASVARSVAALGASGVLDIDARAAPTPGGPPDFRVEVRSDGMAATPAPRGGPGRVRASGVAGAIVVTPDRVRADLKGKFSAAEGARDSAGEVSLDRTRSSAPGGPALSLKATATDADAALPIEDFVQAFAPEAAAEIAAVREEFAFSGRWSGVVDVSVTGEDEPSVRIEVERADALSLLTPGGRAGATTDNGRFTFTRGRAGSPSTVRFDQWSGRVTTDGQDDGTATASGLLTTTGLPAGETLRVEVVGNRFESGVSRWLAARSIAGADEAIRRHNPRGLFDLSLTLQPGPQGWLASGALMPRSLVLSMSGEDVPLGSPTGRVEFRPGQGQVRDLVLMGAGDRGITGSISGGWITDDDGGRAVHAEMRLLSGADPAALLAQMPTGLRAALDELKVRVTGPVSFEPLRLSLNFDAKGELGAYAAGGTIGVADLSMEPGVEVGQGKGRIEFNAERAGALDPSSYDVWGLFDSVRLSGITMTGARARVVGDPSGRVLIPHLSGVCHGGRFAGEAEVGPAAEDGRTYSMAAQFSGVRFASLLAEFAPAAEQDETAVAPAPDESRGLLDASLTIGGRTDRPETRRGRGTGSITGGRVMSLPLLVPLIRASNLELPFEERLDFARADYFIEGALVNFEELSIFSRSVEFFGFGTVRWPDLALDLRFRPRARTRIPLLTPVLEGVRNELVGAQVVGTLREPDVTFTALGGTQRFIGSMFGSSPSEQQRRLEDIERRANARPRTPARDSSPIGDQP
ncbi:MAG: hypothetical protein DYG92_08335 [Leptolyngbya sp. PLA1]|nr:hypothetical protein [Leptolyngbya sp. PLA1]